MADHTSGVLASAQNDDAPPPSPLLFVVQRLREALQELLNAELSMMPPAEDGMEAQTAWAERRAAARNNASALLKEC